MHSNYCAVYFSNYYLSPFSGIYCSSTASYEIPAVCPVRTSFFAKEKKYPAFFSSQENCLIAPFFRLLYVPLRTGTTPKFPAIPARFWMLAQPGGKVLTLLYVYIYLFLRVHYIFCAVILIAFQWYLMLSQTGPHSFLLGLRLMTSRSRPCFEATMKTKPLPRSRPCVEASSCCQLRVLTVARDKWVGWPVARIPLPQNCLLFFFVRFYFHSAVTTARKLPVFLKQIFEISSIVGALCISCLFAGIRDVKLSPPPLTPWFGGSVFRSLYFFSVPCASF